MLSAEGGRDIVELIGLVEVALGRDEDRLSPMAGDVGVAEQGHLGGARGRDDVALGGDQGLLHALPALIVPDLLSFSDLGRARADRCPSCAGV